MEIANRPIDSLKPYPANPRVNDGAVFAVAESIRRFGWRQPIVVDQEGVIVAGHTRWKAAQRLGLTEVPVHVAGDLEAAQIRAYRIADNKLHDLSEWDRGLLASELGDLQLLGADLPSLGFTDDELAKLLPGRVSDGLQDPDAIPEPPDAATTKPGDLWSLGDHRLLCGDSAAPADVDRLLEGAPIHLVNTDPPYNVLVEPASGSADTGGQLPKRKPSWRSTEAMVADGAIKAKVNPIGKTTAKGRRLKSDFMKPEAFDKMLLAWFGNISRVLVPGRGFYIWGGFSNIANYMPALEACELFFHQSIIWDKQHPTITRKDFMCAHEWCFYGWKEGAAHVFLGPNNVTDLWQVKKINPARMIHLTEKPVELAIRAIQYSSRTGENVLDLFGGSGSTLIACEQTGRKAHLMELDALYCDVIIQRWENFTGKKASLLSSTTTVMPNNP